MSHEFESGFFTQKPAWHGLGVVLHQPPSIEEAIKASGLTWEVKLDDLFLTEGTLVTHKATTRQIEKDGELVKQVLGVVGPAYRPLQNADAFKWFQPFVDSKEVTLEAAGSLREGKRVWILAKVVGGTADILKNDPVEQYVLLAHAHDGTLAIRVGFTTIRVVCQNTLSAAVNDKDSSKLLRVRHTSRAITALDEVRKIMNLARTEFEATAEQFRFLAANGCDDATMRRYVREVFVPGKGNDEESSPRIVKAIEPLFEAGIGAEKTRGTFWGAYNAVTQFLTHDRGKDKDARVDNQWFGDSAKLIDRAFSVALEMAGRNTTDLSGEDELDAEVIDTNAQDMREAAQASQEDSDPNDLYGDNSEGNNDGSPS